MIKIIENKLIANFKIDYISNELIQLDEYRKKFKLNHPKKKCVYISEIADTYYKEKYNKNILEVYSQYYDIPRCPISNEFVSYKLSGKIILGKFSSKASNKEISIYIAKNNENYKKHIEKMKIDRKGEGNPMFGIDAWNKGLNAIDNETVRKMTSHRIGTITPDNVKLKQSESAKKRLIHGHTGIKHSEASKQIMREKTIARLKAGKFPQTNSLPHQKVRTLLEEICPNQYYEEFQYGNFSFDFKLNNYLIEVQGDYWHANPNTRHSGATHSVQRVNISRDRAKKKFVLSNKEFILIEIWENDIINNTKKVKQCIQDLINPLLKSWEK